MIFNFIDRLQDSPKSSIYLSVFRLFICFHLFKRIILYWPSLETLFGKNSFVAADEEFIFGLIDYGLLRNHYEVIIYIYLIIIVLYAFGVGKNLTALALFLMFALVQRLNPQVLNGGDNIMFFIMLYMVFVDSYQRFSISSFKLDRKYRKLSNFVTNLAVYSIMIHLCFAYFFSAIGKTNANAWYNGIAVYYTFSSERFMGTSLNQVLAQNGYFVTIATYFTLLFEIGFPFLIWFKKMRLPLVISGISLHLGIYIFMMIHDFQFVFMMIYPLFFTNQELLTFWGKIVQAKQWVGSQKIRLPIREKFSEEVSN